MAKESSKNLIKQDEDLRLRPYKDSVGILANRMNRDIQRNIDSETYRQIFPNTSLNSSNVRTIAGAYMRNSDIFEIVEHKGSYRSAGVGGGITGMGGDILIIDDPVKDRKEADSPTVRQNVYDWYTSTLRTRLAPGGGILLIMTRWHDDDLAGRLLKLQDESPASDQWQVIKYPAIAVNDEEHRRFGEALHSERYSLKDLLSLKESLPARDWEALYQQSPVVEGGSVFNEEWIKYYYPAELPERFSRTCQSWDMTFKDTDGSDYVCGGVWGKKDANIYLLDRFYGRWDFVKTLAEFKKACSKHPKVLTKLIEDKANGPAVIASVRKEVSGVIPVTPTESKLARAYAVTPLFAAGNVYLPHPSIAPWVKDYIKELITFPHAAHDDQVDMTTQALKWLFEKNPLKITENVLNAFWRRRR